MKKIVLTLCGTMLIGLSSTDVSAADPVIEVYGANIGGSIKYRYRIVNKSNVPVSGLLLGVDPGTGEALFPRNDWILDADKLDPVPPADPNRCKPLAAMTCYANIMTDSKYENAYVDMRSLDESSSGTTPGAGDIASGQTSDWLELTVQRAHTNYLTTKGTVYFRSEYLSGAGNKVISLPLNFVIFDTVAPSASGTVSRSISSGVITATTTLTISDNLDPSPKVKLASVTANEALAAGDVQAKLNADTRTVKLKQSVGRIYTLNYAVTDGSNNTKTLALTVSGS
jgi:hypothetical protein